MARYKVTVFHVYQTVYTVEAENVSGAEEVVYKELREQIVEKGFPEYCYDMDTCDIEEEEED